MNSYACLVELLGEEDASQLIATINKLPSGQANLLGVIAASLINDDNSKTILYSAKFNTETSDTLPNVVNYPNATGVILTALDGDIYYRLDGGVADATTQTGHLLPQGATININSKVSNVTTSADPLSNAYLTYYK